MGWEIDSIRGTERKIYLKNDRGHSVVVKLGEGLTRWSGYEDEKEITFEEDVCVLHDIRHDETHRYNLNVSSNIAEKIES